MSRTYTLHVPRDALSGPAALERAELVRDGFSWGAFVFTAFWFFWHRLWLVGLAVLVGLFALGLGLRFIGLPLFPTYLAVSLLSLLIGFEAASLQRWTLARRGQAMVDVVGAANADEAEAKAFARFLADDEAVPGPGPRPSLWRLSGEPHEPVLGLFPDRERRG